MLEHIKIPFVISCLLLVIVSALSVPVVHAAPFDIWSGTGAGGSATCNVEGPCTFCDGMKVIFNIVETLVFVVIPLAVLVIVYGGIRLVTASGSEENVKKGKDAITNAVIGVVIALAAWVVINETLHILTGNISFPWNELQCTDDKIVLPGSGGASSPPSAAGRGWQCPGTTACYTSELNCYAAETSCGPNKRCAQSSSCDEL